MPYLFTDSDIRDSGALFIGTLKQLTWENAARQCGGEKLVAMLHFRPGMNENGLSESPVQIYSQDEFKLYQSQVDEYLVADPKVYIVDRKYYIGI